MRNNALFLQARADRRRRNRICQNYPNLRTDDRGIGVVRNIFLFFIFFIRHLYFFVTGSSIDYFYKKIAIITNFSSFCLVILKLYLTLPQLL
jgi:hypothetical protein